MKTLTKHLFLVFFTASLFSLTGCDSGPKSTKTWQPESEGVISAAVSNTGNFALIGTATGKANLWDLSKKKALLHSWQHQEGDAGGIIAVALSDDDKYALTAETGSLAWWDVKSGKILGFWRIENIKSIAISNDGKSALIGVRDHAQYLSLSRSKPIYNLGHPDFVKAVALSADGRFALTGADNAEARLWSLKDGKLLHTWKYKTKLFSVALSPNGEYAMTNAVLAETKIWKTKSGKLSKTLPPKRVTIASADFSSNNKKLITGKVSQGISLWSVKSGQQTKNWLPKKASDWRPSAANIIALRFTNKDKNLISITSNGIIQRWKAK